MPDFTAVAIAALLSLAPPQSAAPNHCLDCHKGIEEMHPALPLSCVDCHGGNPDAATKEQAHVAAIREMPNDERVLPLSFEPLSLRFRNPTDLRVAKEACGRCHARELDDLHKSMHGTTAGHLSDGFYEYGLSDKRQSKYGVFPETDSDGDVPSSRGGLFRVESLPAFQSPKSSRDLRDHYRDLPRKACMRCHLWSVGTGLRGRLGQDGDYRSQGCAACHVAYADDGLARTGDPTVDRYEPGHPLRHALSRRVPTETCTRCHNGDASIGLNYRGLGQLLPGLPGGPDVPGTTPSRLHGAFYVRDPKIDPPDIHYERGLHCIDCHTVRDVMGDGNLYGAMENAVEIRCESCHGTFRERSNLETARGNPISNLRLEAGDVVLKSKVTLRDHRVKQAKDVLTPGSADYNPRAAAAMTPQHERLACYACHNAWNPLFFGFHLDRNEQFTQLDTLSGERTEGRVSTLEKAFGTFRGLLLGVGSDGRVEPFLVGFSAMASVHGKKGEILVDQEMPVTKASLSGMTLINHQMHTNRPAARGCAECHRSPQAAGLGSGEKFALNRRYGVASHRDGVSLFKLDRLNPEKSMIVSTVDVKGAVATAVRCDPRQGFADAAYAAGKESGLVAIDLAEPEHPKKLGALDVTSPRALLLDGEALYLADGPGGVRVYDVGRSKKPSLLGKVKTEDARGLSISWPYLYVADGPGGLLVIDVGEPSKPAIVASLATLGKGAPQQAAEACDVSTLFQPARPDPDSGRTRARNLAFVADRKAGVRIVDVTDPLRPSPVGDVDLGAFKGNPGFRVKSVATVSHYDIGSERGQIRSEENDYVFCGFEFDMGKLSIGYVHVAKVTDPERPRGVATPQIGSRIAGLSVGHSFNAPFLTTLLTVATDYGPVVYDVSRPALPAALALVPGMADCGKVAWEQFAFDRLVDPSGKPMKDVSHEGARYLGREEIARLLRAKIGGGSDATPGPPRTAESNRPGAGK